MTPPAAGKEGRQPPAVSIRSVLQGILLTVPISFLVLVGVDNLHLRTPGVGIAFTALVLVAGAVLCFLRTPRFRGLGIGLMTGWAVLSIISAGGCTGLARFLI